MMQSFYNNKIERFIAARGDECFEDISKCSNYVFQLARFHISLKLFSFEYKPMQ